MEPLGGMALLEEVRHWGRTLSSFQFVLSALYFPLKM